MKAVRGRAGGVEVVEVDPPDGAGELIAIRSVSICASDLRYLAYGTDRILGHEITGVTQDGTPVIVEGIFGCGDCEYCARGSRNLCRLAGTEIVGCTVDGGMAEYLRAPRRALVPIPAGLAVEDASLAEPGGVAWHACRKAGVGPQTRVLVVGAGAIGLLAVLAALELGAPEVGLVAKHPFQRDLGERFGATPPSGRYDAVIEASGNSDGLAEAIALARPQATVATVGVFPADVVWPYRAAFLKEVAVVPSLGYCEDRGRREIDRVAMMLAGRPEVVSDLITHRFGLDDAVDAFEVVAARKPGTVKVIVQV